MADILKLTYDDGSVWEYTILPNMTWTPTGFCVEYSDYYEIACYSHYKRICKNTFDVMSNIESVNVYARQEHITATLVADDGCEIIRGACHSPIILSSEYWDCECVDFFIQPNSLEKCEICGALKDESPDSHQKEVNAGIWFGHLRKELGLK